MQVIFLLFLFFVSCSTKPSSIRGIAHTHPYHIQIGHHLSKRETKELTHLVDKIFIEVDEVYNHWNPMSELSQNLLTPKVKTILALAFSFREVTDGLYDPSLGGPIHQFKTTGKLPEAPQEIVYDLDGMLKGFTIDLILERLTAKGYKNLYVEWGGDIVTRGNHPSGRPWRVLLDEKPFELINAALATSGCEEQLWEIDGQILTHIINPHSLKMIEIKNEQVHRVSVKASTGAFADALATACMACGHLEDAYLFAKKIKKQCPEVEFWVTSYRTENNPLYPNHFKN